VSDLTVEWVSRNREDQDSVRRQGEKPSTTEGERVMKKRLVAMMRRLSNVRCEDGGCVEDNVWQR
jgi:hypothetical protein